MSTKLNPLPVTELLREYDLRPTKGLGQNFLQSEKALRQITNAANILPDDWVLEIGPGLGSLTRHLALAAQQVIAVEIDARLLPPLHEVLSPFKNVRLIHGDILAQDPGELVAQSGYLVVANIPYYITSAVIRHLLETEQKPRRLVLTVQMEVAERICAQPPELSLLALSVQVYGKPEIVTRVPAGAFYPAPKVDSAVVRVELYPQPAIPVEGLGLFFKLAKAGFSQKRKTLRNALSAGMGWSKDETVDRLQAAGIDPQRRAETLTLSEWQQLVGYCASI